MTNHRDNRRKIKKRKQRKINLLLIVTILVVTVIFYFTRLYFILSDTLDIAYMEDKRIMSPLRNEVVHSNKSAVSILFIGSDRGGGRGTNDFGLSDALILATFNPDEKSINLVSIPRDTYAYLPVKDQYNKINHAHAYGGPLATVSAVESLFNVPVDYFVSINFDALIGMVDALDGIYIDVPFEISEMNSDDVKDAIKLSPGHQLLNGEEALAFSRTRKYDNDIERGKRQQLVVKSIINRLVSPKIIVTIDDVIKSVGPHMKSNLTSTDLIGFIQYTLSDVQIEQLVLEGNDIWTNAYYYEVTNDSLNKVSQSLQEHLELNP
jgi:LCP family protein required for cell wall assembly